jgi:hypothetical protein
VFSLYQLFAESFFLKTDRVAFYYTMNKKDQQNKQRLFKTGLVLSLISVITYMILNSYFIGSKLDLRNKLSDNNLFFAEYGFFMYATVRCAVASAQCFCGAKTPNFTGQ